MGSFSLVFLITGGMEKVSGNSIQKTAKHDCRKEQRAIFSGDYLDEILFEFLPLRSSIIILSA